MSKEIKDHSKNTEDGWNRTFFGSPTFGGFVVVGIVIVFLFLTSFLNSGRGTTVIADYSLCIYPIK